MDGNSVAKSDNVNDQGWETVSYHKKNRNSQPLTASDVFSGGYNTGEWWADEDVNDNTPWETSDETPWEATETEKPAEDVVENNDNAVNGNGTEVADASAVENQVTDDVKKTKAKKSKVTVAQAASQINASDLASFLAEITVFYDNNQEIQLMRFADYIGSAFGKVTSAQFPWMKILKDASVTKMADIPVAHISEQVYKTAEEWLSHHSVDVLGPFVKWSLDNILEGIPIQQGAKGSKKAVQQAPSKSKVAFFVIAAMVLRLKPEVFIDYLLPIVKGNKKYQGSEKITLYAWMIVQASKGDLIVGMFSWINFLLPMLSESHDTNPRSKELIVQLVERMLATPKAKTILMNGPVRKGERVVPPVALDLLMRATFPEPSAKLELTERLEAVYPTLKDVALAVSPGSKAMRQLTQKMLVFAMKTVGEAPDELSNEATQLFFWCLRQNPDCYKQWDIIYLENVEASVVIMKKLLDETKEDGVNEVLKSTLKGFLVKNEKAICAGENVETLKSSSIYCKMLLGGEEEESPGGEGEDGEEGEDGGEDGNWLKNLILVTVAVALFAVLFSEVMKFVVDVKKHLDD